MAALTDIGRCTGTRTRSPITNCVHLHTSGGALFITGDYLNQRLVRSVDCEGEIESAVVRHAWLKAAIGIDEVCKIEVSNGRIKIYNGNTKSEMSLERLDMWPQDTECEYREIGTLCKDISVGINAVKAFQHRGIDRMMMSCVHVLGGAKSLMVEATNGVCAARWSESVISADFDLTIPREFVDSVQEYLAIEGADIGISDHWGLISFPGGEYRFRLTNELFPTCDHIFKDSGKFISEFDIDSFLRFCQQAMSCSDESGYAVVSTRYSPQGVFLKSGNAYYDISALISGEYPEYSIKSNAAYVIQILKSFPDKKVKIYGGEFKIHYSGGNLSIHLAAMRDTPPKNQAV